MACWHSVVSGKVESIPWPVNIRYFMKGTGYYGLLTVGSLGNGTGYYMAC